MAPRPASREAAVRHLLDQLQTGSRVVLIDGPSGSGKSTLAAELHERATQDGKLVGLLHLDEVYPGWTGLRSGAREVAEQVVVPLSSGRPGSCLRYDWVVGQKTRPLFFPAGRPLIIEGVGALHPLSAPRASGRVWVTAATVVRRTRAFDRDGETYRPYWRLWAAQEADYIRKTAPHARADLIVDTTTAEEEEAS